MKATGIVRRIDELGRVVIPKPIRRTMRIRENDALEIYTDKNGEIIFKKYSPMAEFASYAAMLCDSLSESTKRPVAICDCDEVIASSGAPEKELLRRNVSEELDMIIQSRQLYQYKAGGRKLPAIEDNENYFVSISAPILADGDIWGSVVFFIKEDGGEDTEVEQKLAQNAAAFLGKQVDI
ncbi:MAG: AbrB/MazE/SpoVT family DNA-binding domain-containing protein [Oscillospiraceae bacterium]|nr:AbrB/MazE/SpoVT family DNA-binding domain-containing protein [Oscillospiraceae bacterium]